MFIQTTRLPFVISKRAASHVTYELPNHYAFEVHKALDLVKAVDSFTIPPVERAMLRELGAACLNTWNTFSDLEEPVYYARHAEEDPGIVNLDMTLLSLSLTEYTRTVYSTEYHPLDLEVPLEELLRRADFLSKEPGGVHLLRALRIEAMEEISHGIENPFHYERRPGKLKAKVKETRDEVLAYIASF
nr:hypothetical protein [uncultured Rhodoferax sp.]